MTNTHKVLLAFLGLSAAAGVAIVWPRGEAVTPESPATTVSAAASSAVVEVPVEEPVAEVVPPRFDSVLIEADGSGVIAGAGAPGSEVTILVDGQAVGTAEADASGSFVALIDVAPSDAPRMMVLSFEGDDGPVLSEQSVVVAPVQVAEPVVAAAEAEAEGGDGEAVAAAEPEAAVDEATPEVVEVAETEDGSAVAAEGELDVALAEVVTDLTEGVEDEIASGDVVDAGGETAEPGAEVIAEVAEPVVAPEDEAAVAELEAVVEETVSVDEVPADGVVAEVELPAAEEVADTELPAAEDVAAAVVDEVAAILPEAVLEDGDALAADAELETTEAPAVAGGDGGLAEAEVEVADVEPDAPVVEVDVIAEVEEAVAPVVDVTAPGGAFGSPEVVATAPDVATEVDAGAVVEAGDGLAALEVEDAPVTAPQPLIETEIGSLAVPDIASPGQAPILLADAEGVRVLQPALAPGADAEVLRTVALDAISYDPSGDVALTGRAGGEAVQVYLDNAPVLRAEVAGDGTWRGVLSDVIPGVYTLRVDELDAGGAVSSRIELPFLREERETIAAVLAEEFEDETVEVAVRTVQPGNTLWGISQERYGDGILYVQVFEANRDLIRDPDLIYPGQILRLPE